MNLSSDINNEPYEFRYIKNILPGYTYSRLVEWLQTQEYKSGKCISGKVIPRLQNWYQMDKRYFCDSWKYRYDRWISEDYDEFLLTLQKYISEQTSKLINKPIQFNSCLVNKYRDGNDTIKAHRDCVESFGEYPIIAGISVGTKRTFRITKIVYNQTNSKSLKKDDVYQDIELEDNSLLIMSGASQKYFTHEVLKDESIGPRYSLTFRDFIN